MKYEQELLDRIYDLFATGDYSIEHICRQVGISEETFYQWKKDPNKPEFSESLKIAQAKRLEAFKNMARSGLAKRLDFHVVEENKVENKLITKKRRLKHPDGTIEEFEERVPVKASETKITKVFPPSDNLIMFTLNNQDPENFRHVSHHQHTGKDGEPLPDNAALQVYILPDGTRMEWKA